MNNYKIKPTWEVGVLQRKLRDMPREDEEDEERYEETQLRLWDLDAPFVSSGR